MVYNCHENHAIKQNREKIIQNSILKSGLDEIDLNTEEEHTLI